MPCRINRSRLWVGRMIAEAAEHPYSTFLTLTFSPAHLPVDGHLSKKPLQLFLKKLRAETAPRTIRYYAVGEYGTKNWRPHYHLILFNVSPTEEKLLQKCWPQGMIYVGTVQSASISYVCGYMTKRMTNKKDLRLNGKPPEFATMSLRPGLGAGIVPRILKAYKTEAGQAALAAEGWIASHLQTTGFKYPMGKYITNKLVASLDLEDQRTPHNNRIMIDAYRRKQAQTTTEYEKQRKARVDQQAGKCKPQKQRDL